MLIIYYSGILINNLNRECPVYTAEYSTLDTNYIMAERRARRQVRSEAAPYDVDNGRASSYDLTLLDNWTTTQLKAELSKLNVKYNNGDRRAT